MKMFFLGVIVSLLGFLAILNQIKIPEAIVVHKCNDGRLIEEVPVFRKEV